MHDVFISYSSKNKNVADAIGALNRSGSLPKRERIVGILEYVVVHKKAVDIGEGLVRKNALGGASLKNRKVAKVA